MTDTVRREYVAEVQSIGQQSSGEGWVLALTPRPGMKYPDSFYGKDAAVVKDLKPGQRYTLVLERGRLKKNKTEGSTNPFDYFENVLEVRAAPAEAPTASRPRQEPGVGVAGTGRASEFRSPVEIIRGVALEQATRLAVALVAAGESVRSPQVIIMASKYEHYILTGEIPNPPDPPTASPPSGAQSTTAQAPTPAARPVPAGGQPGKPTGATLAEAVAAPEPGGGAGQPAAPESHPSASPATASVPAFENWGAAAGWCLSHIEARLGQKVSMSDFLAWAGQHLGHKIGAWPAFGPGAEGHAAAVQAAREYVAAMKEV